MNFTTADTTDITNPTTTIKDIITTTVEVTKALSLEDLTDTNMNDTTLIALTTPAFTTPAIWDSTTSTFETTTNGGDDDDPDMVMIAGLVVAVTVVVIVVMTILIWFLCKFACCKHYFECCRRDPFQRMRRRSQITHRERRTPRPPTIDELDPGRPRTMNNYQDHGISRKRSVWSSIKKWTAERFHHQTPYQPEPENGPEVAPNNQEPRDDPNYENGSVRLDTDDPEYAGAYEHFPVPRDTPGRNYLVMDAIHQYENTPHTNQEDFNGVMGCDNHGFQLDAPIFPPPPTPHTVITPHTYVNTDPSPGNVNLQQYTEKSQPHDENPEQYDDDQLYENTGIISNDKDDDDDSSDHSYENEDVIEQLKAQHNAFKDYSDGVPWVGQQGQEGMNNMPYDDVSSELGYDNRNLQTGYGYDNDNISYVSQESALEDSMNIDRMRLQNYHRMDGS